MSIYGSFASDGVTPIVTNGSEFLIAYNKVTLAAWFSEGNRYDSPNSYTTGPRSDGIFEFSAFPLYAFALMRDRSVIRSMEVHNTDLLGNISTFNPGRKYKFRDGQPMVTYNAGIKSPQTGQLNANNVGDLSTRHQMVLMISFQLHLVKLLDCHRHRLTSKVSHC